MLLATILFFLYNSNVIAVNSPLNTPNNKFGIHVFSEKDLNNAQKLVNSGGGDWGYVTIVITEKERDHGRWQNVFDQMRRLHLIPIIRIATSAKGDTWQRPKESEINNWVSFLNNLNWVTQNRYIIIGNEPNHATEWGGSVDPESYGQYLYDFSQSLKRASPDFYILPAAMDASAKNVMGTMDEAKFLTQMINSIPTVFDYVDGWNSHSYPNPDFAGKETDSGKGSIKTYDWELTFLQEMGIKKTFPVFITETGWSNKKISEDEIVKKLDYAFKYIWSDRRVVAVTPFILDYTEEPFAQFSWQKKDGSFYKYFGTVQNLPKIKGEPVQLESGQILVSVAQPVIPRGVDFYGVVLARNTGQSIWTSDVNTLKSDANKIDFRSVSFDNFEPLKLGLIVFRASSPSDNGVYSQSLYLAGTRSQRITNSSAVDAYVFTFTQIGRFFENIFNSKN